jgi:hypothetical protein
MDTRKHTYLMDKDTVPAVTGCHGEYHGLAAGSAVDDGDAGYSSGLMKWTKASLSPQLGRVR